MSLGVFIYDQNRIVERLFAVFFGGSREHEAGVRIAIEGSLASETNDGPSGASRASIR